MNNVNVKKSMSSQIGTGSTMDNTFLPEDTQLTADELNRQLLNLKEENKQMGKINQELNEKLRDATTYNQALGLDLYRLDQLISEVEDKYRTNLEKTRELHAKTKELKRKTNDYKSALGENSEAAEMAKKMQILQEFRDQATRGLGELESILSDDNFTELHGALHSLEEKIHFLFWNNHDLEHSVNAVSKKLPQNQLNQLVDKNCGTIEKIKNTKDDWEKIKLYQSRGLLSSSGQGENSNPPLALAGPASISPHPTSVSKSPSNVHTNKNISNPNEKDSRPSGSPPSPDPSDESSEALLSDPEESTYSSDGEE